MGLDLAISGLSSQRPTSVDTYYLGGSSNSPVVELIDNPEDPGANPIGGNFLAAGNFFGVT